MGEDRSPQNLFFPLLSSPVGRGPGILEGAVGKEDFLILLGVTSEQSQLCYVIARDTYKAHCALWPASQASTDYFSTSVPIPGWPYRKQRMSFPFKYLIHN